jgi:ArsR family transcriptional regulator
MKAQAGQSITERLSALADTVRLRILRALEAEELSVGEVASVVQLPQSTVSRHLKLLADAGWVARRHEGTATLYRFVLDDLPTPARALWLASREQVADLVDLDADRRRLQAVLAERRTNSEEVFGRVGGEWDAIRASLFGHVFTLDALLHFLPRDWTVADLGCGTGNAAEHLAPCVAHVYAVDQSETMLDAARKRLDGHTNVTFVSSDLEALSLDDASVDAAVTILVLHHMPDPRLAINEMARILRPRGVALIVDMVRHDRDEYRSKMGHVHLGFEPDAVAAMLEDAGLTDVTARYLTTEPDARGPGVFIARAAKPDAHP